MRGHRNRACRVVRRSAGQIPEIHSFLYALGDTNHDYLSAIGPCQLLIWRGEDSRSFGRERRFRIRKDVCDNRSIGSGKEHFAVSVGRSGCPPSDGVVRFEGEDIATTGYSKHRREHVSLVFQDHNLIDYLTPEENLRLVNPKADMKILEDLGLSREESKRNIMHLSGGQRQRVAVGRALVAPGRAILADEPTGSLDPEMTDEVIDLLRHAAHQLGKCVIVVTHSKRVADSADAVYTLRHKKLAKA